MSEQANILAKMLTDMDQKLNALGEQQKALDAKLERYSAFTVKKLNDSVEKLCNMQEAQLKIMTESLTKMEKQADVMEKQIAALQGKIRKEKQLNVQMKLNAELKALKRELEET